MTRYKSVLDLPPHMRKQVEAMGIVAAGTPAANDPAFASAEAANDPSFAPKRTKYGNTPIIVDGERFDSKLEWRCREWLRSRWQSGEVLWFTRQVPFRLEGGVIYRADFLAALASGGVEVIDAKGRDTPASANKRKQVLSRYGISVILWPDSRASGVPRVLRTTRVEL